MYFFNSGLQDAQIIEVENLSPKVRRIRISGQSIQQVSWQPGDKIKILAGPKLRSYTPSRINNTEGWMDIVFYLHGNGKASDWAKTAKVGIETCFLGPVRSMPSFDDKPDWVIFLGDETTIGLAVSLLKDLSPSVNVHGAIELAAPDIPSLQKMDLDLTPAIRTQKHGDALLQWLEDFNIPEGKGLVWLSGEVSSVRALKTSLMARGLHRSQLKIKPYWSVKGHAHRKSLQPTL